MSAPRRTDSVHQVSSHTRQNLSLTGTPTTKAKTTRPFTPVSDTAPLLFILTKVLKMQFVTSFLVLSAYSDHDPHSHHESNTDARH